MSLRDYDRLTPKERREKRDGKVSVWPATVGPGLKQDDPDAQPQRVTRTWIAAILRAHLSIS